MTFMEAGIEQATVMGSEELTTAPPDCVLSIIGFPLNGAEACGWDDEFCDMVQLVLEGYVDDMDPGPRDVLKDEMDCVRLATLGTDAAMVAA